MAKKTISKTRTFVLDTARVRKCLYCGKYIASTSPGDRQCASCEKSIATTRMRAATDVRENKLDISNMFDYDRHKKNQWAKFFDMRERARKKGDKKTEKYAEEMMKKWD